MDMVRVQQKTRGQNCLESRDARLAQQLARLVRDLDLLHRVRPCLGTKFLKTTVFKILYYTLVMTIP
jgi:hypothetical protein